SGSRSERKIRLTSSLYSSSSPFGFSSRSSPKIWGGLNRTTQKFRVKTFPLSWNARCLSWSVLKRTETGFQFATFWNTKSRRSWNRGTAWSRGPVSISTDKPEIGIIVDAGPKLGYGHAVRCVRLARALTQRNRIVFYPQSEECSTFVERFGFSVLDSRSNRPFPPLVVTDLREPHGMTAAIRRDGSRHISIHDLGLAQCHSDVAIDGSVTRLFPYTPLKDQSLFLGPQYMITR